MLFRSSSICGVIIILAPDFYIGDGVLVVRHYGGLLGIQEGDEDKRETIA